MPIFIMEIHFRKTDGLINGIYFYADEWCKLPPVMLIFSSMIMQSNKYEHIYYVVSHTLRVITKHDN